MNPEQALPLYCLFMFALFGGLALRVPHKQQERDRVREHIAALQAADPALIAIDDWYARYRLLTVNGSRRRGLIYITLTTRRITAYDQRSSAAILDCAPEQVRWFGRPQPYHSGLNEIWLHAQAGDEWLLLRVWLYPLKMRDLVRALKGVCALELVTAYRRRRPYVHHGPLPARPAAQDIHGAWTLAEPISLYLMPRFLVILEGRRVLRTLPLEAVQQIGALRRLDQPGAQGLLRFRSEEETFAFALDDHARFAAALAEAAKRSLEAPVERKQKDKDAHDDD